MQYTTHYNLNLPEGTDIVNPLIQDNPNYSAIDSAMYANKLRVIGDASEIASGTVHAITRVDTDIPAFKFVATSDYNTGDTFTVDGVTVTARRADGTVLKNKAYVINSTVLCILDGTILNLIGIEGVIEADDVDYDNQSSGLAASNTQGAIDELASRVKWRRIYEDEQGNIYLTGETFSEAMFDVAGTTGTTTPRISINFIKGYACVKRGGFYFSPTNYVFVSITYDGNVGFAIAYQSNGTASTPYTNVYVR